MNPDDITVAVAISQGFWPNLRLSLKTIPDQVAVVVAWYGPGEPETLPVNVQLVRPKRIADNFMRGYGLNVAIRAAQTRHVLLGDADFLYPRLLFTSFSLNESSVYRFYVGRLTRTASEQLRNGGSWENLFCDYQGAEGRIFGNIYGAHNPCIYPSTVLHQLRGYDERMVGWGGEDDDLSFRTRRMGVNELRIPLIVADLHHDNSPDYPDTYGRGNTSENNRNVLNDMSRPAAANFDGWGDGE